MGTSLFILSRRMNLNSRNQERGLDPGGQGGGRRVMGGVVLRGLPGSTVPGVLEQQGQQALDQRQSTQVTG